MQKSDYGRLKAFDMVIATLLVDGKDRKSRFFEKTFLLADISMVVIFKIFFFILNNVKVNYIN